MTKAVGAAGLCLGLISTVLEGRSSLAFFNAGGTKFLFATARDFDADAAGVDGCVDWAVPSFLDILDASSICS